MIEVITNIVTNLLMFSPIILLFYLINLSERDRTLENPAKGKGLGIVTYILVILGHVTFFVLGLFFNVFGWFVNSPAGAETKSKMLAYPEAFPFDVEKMFESLEWIGLGFWVPSLIAMLVVIPAVRRAVAKLIPIDPFRRTHALSLSMSMLVFINLFLTLAIGLETINESMGQLSEAAIFSSIWSQDILLAILGLIGVGWLSRRNWSQALERLGLVKPTGMQMVMGLVIALGMVFIVRAVEFAMLGVGYTGDAEVNELTQKLLGSLFVSIPGVLTIGLAAALGEEIIFRGALQPRFGLIFTTLLFALVHSNYGLTLSTLIVFVVGLGLGLVRIRFNTSTSMIVHAAYNIGLVGSYYMLPLTDAVY